MKPLTIRRSEPLPKMPTLTPRESPRQSPTLEHVAELETILTQIRQTSLDSIDQYKKLVDQLTTPGQDQTTRITRDDRRKMIAQAQECQLEMAYWFGRFDQLRRLVGVGPPSRNTSTSQTTSGNSPTSDEVVLIDMNQINSHRAARVNGTNNTLSIDDDDEEDGDIEEDDLSDEQMVDVDVDSDVEWHPVSNGQRNANRTSGHRNGYVQTNVNVNGYEVAFDEDDEFVDEEDDDGGMMLDRKQSLIDLKPKLSQLKQLTGSGRVVCKLCGRRFQKPCGLGSHMRTHFSGDQKLKCQHCDREFITKGGLAKHVQNKHK